MRRTLACLLTLVAVLLAGCPQLATLSGEKGPLGASPPATGGSAPPNPSQVVGQGVVSGIILGLDGKPAAGVTVRAFAAPADLATVAPLTTVAPLQQAAAGYAERRIQSGEAVTTDASGAFTLPNLSGLVNIEAVLSDQVKALLPNVATTADKVAQVGNVPLKPTGNISGKVSSKDSPDTTNYEGVDVFVPGLPYMVKTDAAGNYSLLNVPAGSYTVVATKPGSTLGRGYASDVKVDPYQTAACDLAMALTSPVIAQIVPSIAAPGQTVTLKGDNFGSSDSSQLLVFFGSTLASKQRLDDHTIKVTVPSSAVNGDVTVVVGGNQSNGAKFTVIKYLTLGWTTRTLLLGRSFEATASARDSDGRLILDSVPIQFAVVSGDAVTLSGRTFYGVKEGAASIKASIGDVNSQVGTFNVFEVTGVTLSPETATIAPLGSSSGTTVTLTATTACSDGQDRGVTWSSSNPAVATVNSNGVVQGAPGVMAGTAQITATSVDDPRFSASATVTVLKPGVQGVAVTPSEVTLNAKPDFGQTPGAGYVTSTTMTAVVNATIPTHGVTWSSSDTSRVTVDAGGVVSTVAGAPEGDVTITATSNDDSTVKATASVHVTIFGGVTVGIN